MKSTKFAGYLCGRERIEVDRIPNTKYWGIWNVHTAQWMSVCDEDDDCPFTTDRFRTMKRANEIAKRMVGQK